MNRNVSVPGERLEAQIVIPGVGLLKYRDVAIAVFMGENMWAVAMTHSQGRQFEVDTKGAQQALKDDAVIDGLEGLL